MIRACSPNHKQFLSWLTLILILVLIVPGCDLLNNDDDNNRKDKVLISFEEKGEYLPELIHTSLQLLSNQYPEIDPLMSKIDYAVQVYKIEYSTKFQGDDVVASGLVCVPLGEGEIEFPVMTYHNGTNTEHSNAPSENPGNILYKSLQFMASTGFIVAIPDYLGFGSSEQMFHPYLHGESTVRCVLDMQKALKELVENHLDAKVSKDLYITGYSQGGWATMQVQKALEENFAAELTLKASACAAGPYNLNALNDYVLGLQDYPMPYFLGYLYNSYFNLGIITNPAEDIFQDPYGSKITSLYDGSNSGDEINNELTTTISDLFTSDFISNYKTDEKYSSVVSSLSANSIEAWKVKTPTMLLHGTEDNLVPASLTSNLYQEFLNEGVGVNNMIFAPMQGETHQSGVIPAGIAAIMWFIEIRDSGGM